MCKNFVSKPDHSMNYLCNYFITLQSRSILHYFGKFCSEVIIDLNRVNFNTPSTSIQAHYHNAPVRQNETEQVPHTNAHNASSAANRRDAINKSKRSESNDDDDDDA